MMISLWIVLGLLVLGWLLLNLPRGRADGELVTRIHPYRKMLPYIMAGRNESIVYYDDYVSAEPLLEYIRRAQQELHVDITHCLVHAAKVTLFDQPKMNQFIAGKRLYARRHVEVTFSMKRRKLDKEAKLSAVKMRFGPEDTFAQTCRRINERIGVERSEAETYTDKELGIMTRLPRPLLSLAIRFIRWLDYHNLVPASFIDNDGFYTNVFIANLGSLGMAAAYHHLYEYGTCPLFMMVGRIEDRPAVVEGKVVPLKSLQIRWSYDERIDDGLTAKHGLEKYREVLENPDRYFGELPEQDGSSPPADSSEKETG